MHHHLLSLILAPVLLMAATTVSAADRGLVGTYFDNFGFSGQAFTRVDATVDFPWENGSPAASMGADTFSVRWTATVRPRFSETYTLYATTDDGVRVWIDGHLVIDAWRDRAPATSTAMVTLTAGAAHELRMDYYEGGGDASAKLEWSSVSQAREVIPAACLEATPVAPVAPFAVTAIAINATHVNVAWDYIDAGQTGFRVERAGVDGAYTTLGTLAASERRFDDRTTGPGTAYTYRISTLMLGGATPGTTAGVTTPAGSMGGLAFIASYWDNRDFTGTRVDRFDQVLSFPWGDGSPDSRIGADTFSVRWQGRLQVPQSGAYEFRLTSDDGVRFWLGDQVVIDRWTDHGPTVDTATVVLDASLRPGVRIEYYENYGGATLTAEWRPAGGAWSPLQVLAELPPPFPPQGLAAVATSAPAVALTWQSPGDGGDDVLIERSIGSGAPWTMVVQAPATVTSVTDTSAPAGATCRYRAVSLRGAERSTPSPEVTVTLPTLGTGTGLTGLYTSDPTFDSIALSRTDAQVSFDWGNAAPAAGVASDGFAIRWMGQLEPVLSETYTIRVSADDAFRLFLDGNLVIDAWTMHLGEREITVPCTAGQKIAIRLDYQEVNGGAYAKVEWWSAHHPREIIPSRQLYPVSDAAAPSAIADLRATLISNQVVELAWTPASDDTAISHYRIERDGVVVGRSLTPGFRDLPLTPLTGYSYRITPIDAFAKVGPVSAPLTLTTRATPSPGSGTGLTVVWYPDVDLERPLASSIDPVLDHVWTGAPLPGVPADGFAGTWTGWIQPLYSEDYTLTLSYDAGARVWIDGQLLASSWGGGLLSHTWSTSTRSHILRATLTAGNRHVIRIDLADTTGNAVMKLVWESPSQLAQVIPTTQLYPLDNDGRFRPVVTTPAISRVSPAHVAGAIGGPGTGLTGFVRGLPVPIERMGDRAWLAVEAGPGLPPGVVLDPDVLTELRVVASDGSSTGAATQWLTWEETDFANLPYGLVELILRKGDSLLLSASVAGDTTFIQRTQQGAEVARWTVAHGTRLARRFDSPGSYLLSAFRGSLEIATLPLTVAGMDWQGPTACAINFERQKQVAVQGIAPAKVMITGQDPARTAVRTGSTTTAGVANLLIKPLIGGSNAVLARLGNDGPVIARMPVDEFTLISTGSEHVHVLGILPGGILKAETDVVLQPWVQPLDIRAYTFTAGMTFDDGTTERWIAASTLDPLPDGTGGTTELILLKPIVSNTAICHALQAFQAGVQVSP